MANGECSNEYQQLPPVLTLVADAKCGNKKEMIKSRKRKDVFDAEREIHREIIHENDLTTQRQM